MDRWMLTPERTESSGWVELDEAPSSALWAWAAAPDHLRRISHSDAGRLVRVTTERDGVTSLSTERFTLQDRQTVESAINDYLESAGIPPRPTGFAWFLRIPPQMDGRSFLHELDVGIRSPQVTRRGLTRYLREVEDLLAKLYR